MDKSACALLHTHRRTNVQVACWGNGDQGRLGLGSNSSSSVPRLLGALKEAVLVGVSCGGAHTAAVAKDGSAFLWGLNDNGQLVQGSSSPYLQVLFALQIMHAPVHWQADATQAVFVAGMHVLCVACSALQELRTMMYPHRFRMRH